MAAIDSHVDFRRSSKTPVEELHELKNVTTVDTVHQDEAFKVLARYEGDQTWTEQEEARLRRKLDWRLLPVLCLTYGLQYYDKAMLSQAVSRLSEKVFRGTLTPTRLFSGSERISI